MIVNAARLIPTRDKTASRPVWFLNPFIRLPAYLLLVFLTLMVASLLMNSIFPGHPESGNTVVQLLASLVYLGLLTGIYYVLIRKVERRPVYELSGPVWITEIIIGIVIGIVLIAAVVLIFALSGFYKIDAFNPVSSVLSGFIVFGYGAFFEELVFRLIIFKLLEEYFGSWISVAISALIFGVAHIFNDHATLWSALAIAIEAGVLLSMAFIFTRRIWMALGIHFAWNFMQASVFGLPASGMETGGLISAEISGPAWFTGGEFGVEASPVTIVLGLLLSWFLLQKALQDNQMILPAWRKKNKPEIRY